MEKRILICDCCGREFSQEYWNGGYIDHSNFSGSLLGTVMSCGNFDVDTLVRETCYDNLKFRTNKDIDERIECVKAAMHRNRRYNTVLREYCNKVKDELSKKEIVDNEVENLKNRYKDDRIILYNIANKLS